MRRLKPVIVLVSVALVAALIAHVTIDILGDHLLAHDTYDDIDHGSRAFVALATLGLTTLGISLAFRAALAEARGSEDAFCLALRSALPRRTCAFIGACVVAAAFVLCLMEGCDALLAGIPVDDAGDLFGGSIVLGGTTVTLTAAFVGMVALCCLRRLARARIVPGVVVAFLRRCAAPGLDCAIDFDVTQRLVFHAHHLCRRIAGRAPPLTIRFATL